MPYRPSLRQLEYIVALDETGHFGKAAERCHVSQPTLSVQVALVEKCLSVVLFERTANGVVTTAAGHAVVRGARLALAAVDEFVGAAYEDAGSLGGTIRLATTPTLGPYFLPRLLPTIHQKYPQLKIYIREDRPTAVETSVLDGAFDCGLGPAPERRGLTFHPIGNERLFLGVPADHRLADYDEICPDMISGEKLLALGSGHQLLDNVNHLAAASGAHIVDDYEGTSLDAIRQMVSIGMGLSLFPELYARAEFRGDDDVKLLTIKGWNEKRVVGFYWRENSGRERHYRILANEAQPVAQQAGIR